MKNQTPHMPMLTTRLYWTAYLAFHLRGQAAYPFKPLSSILRDQSRRVRSIVAYAYRHVPYYRETMKRLGLTPDDFKTADDLAKLPILEREQLQRDPEYFVSDALPLASYLKLRSGGSCGAPRTVYYDIPALFQNTAHSNRERAVRATLIGTSVGYRQTIIISAISTTAEIRRIIETKALLPKGLRVEQQYLSLLDPPEQNVPLLNEFKPHVIHSYGSYLTMIFAYLQTTGAEFHLPKVVTYSSDGMSDSARRLIEQEFKIPVLSTYQSIEAFKIGFECEQHSGLHLNLDLYPVRIVDTKGHAQPHGEHGDVIVSNLVNRATMLLNYRLGDIAAVLPEPCPCGRSLPLLSFPEGRNDDMLVLPSGQLIHPQVLRTIFTNEELIWQYQVAQRTPTYFTLRVVASDDCDHQRTKERITAKFAHVFGPNVTVDITFVDSIDRTEAGKFRPVHSLLRQAPQK